MRDLRELPLDRILVSPSVLAADFTELAAEIDRAVQGKADLIHLDVMDGCFVPNISFGPPVIKSIRKRTELILDTHIMIEHPVRYAKAFAEAGSDHLTFHLECADPTAEAIEAIRQAGCTVGISLKPATPAEAVFPWLDRIDLVLVMTVEPGFGGQAFIPASLEKIAQLRALADELGTETIIEVDGGISSHNAHEVFGAGADVLVAGSSVFGAEDPQAEVVKMLNA